jgi:hypothetical protein
MIDWSLSQRETDIVQILLLIAAAVFIGGRFLPARYRQPVGVALTVCYLLGVAVFMAYVLLR